MSREYFKILKPKTRPIQIEPWFFRYLSAGQLKVLSAIIAHADYKTRQDNSFASNKTIAFYAGFGLINKDTKDYEYFQTLSEDEQKAYKNKKIKNAIQTVKNIKKQLADLGVIKRELIGTKSFSIVDLEWGKERYLKEFDEFFNDETTEVETTENDISKELEHLSKLADDGNISKENLAKQMQELADKLTATTTKEKEINIVVPADEIDKVAEHIMNSKKVQTKVKSGDIKNPIGYKKTIIKQIKNNTYNGIEKVYEEFLNTNNTSTKQEIDTTDLKNPIDIFIKIYQKTQRFDYAYLEASKGLSFQEKDELKKFRNEFEQEIIWKEIMSEKTKNTS